ncbi:MAG: NIPSNAP family protein [Acidobacteriia bacterium]|nr:NIPSNAP family protein [Terriglobia bacterium]
MNRRTLLASSLAASALAGAGPLGSLAGGEKRDPATREYYELRLYHLRRGPQVKRMDDFMSQACAPALKRAGLGPLGAFDVTVGPSNPTLYLLMAYPSLDVFASLGVRLAEDAEFQKAGADFLNATAADPAYVRVESALLAAFPGMPRLEVPPAAAEHRPRIFELRTYESHSKKADLKKIEMFDRGEIAIFRRTGLRPVFFGETLIGRNLPNLTYMVTFDDMEARQKNWAAFVADPDWKKLSTTPGYTDVETVSNITNVILSPKPYSEI